MTAPSRIPFARVFALALLTGLALSSATFAEDSAAVPEDIVTATIRSMAEGKADVEREAQARQPATTEPPPFILNRVAPAEPSPLK